MGFRQFPKLNECNKFYRSTYLLVHNTWARKSWTWRKLLVWGANTPISKELYFPLTCHSIICSLGERPIPPAPRGATPTPQADIHPSSLWTMIDRTVREQFILLLRNTTVVILIMLGCMSFGVWHERDSDKGGGQTPQLLFSWRLGLYPSGSDTSEIVA